MLDELLETPAAMGIEPVGSMERMPGLVELRTWHPVSDQGVSEVSRIAVEPGLDVTRAPRDAAAAIER